MKHFLTQSLVNRLGCLLIAGAALSTFCVQTHATVVPGTVIGIFSNPILVGQVTNDPSLGQSTYLNTTGTAISFINNSSDPTLVGTPLQQATGSTLVWGAFSGSSGPETFSELAFFGDQIPQNSHQPFQLGTITFANGTSDLNSLIFGATLSFYDNVVSPQTFLGSDTISITTTSNLDQSIAQDADYFNICGNSSSICATSIEAYEATQGGTGVTVNLTGQSSVTPCCRLIPWLLLQANPRRAAIWATIQL